MNKKIIFYFIIILLLGCTNKNKNLFTYFKQMNISLLSQSKQIIVVIPLIGCHSCIEQTIEAINQYSEKINITVALVNFDKMQLKHYKEMLNNKVNILFDKKEMAYNYNFIDDLNRPIILFIDKKRIKKSIHYDFSKGTHFLLKNISDFLAKK